VWSDRRGVETPISSLERRADSPRLSPDGSKVAFRTPAANCDVWVYDIARGTTTRLTQQGDNHGVAWSPDGSRVAVARVGADGTDILALSSDGTGSGERLAEFGSAAGASGIIPLSWSKTANVMLVEDRFGHETGLDILAIPATGGKPEPVINTPFEDSSAVLSPDGRFIAYVSDETGRNEVYVRPFKGAGVRVQVSSEGGSEPVWDRQGKELFFRNESSFLVVEIRTDTGVAASRPRVLFSKRNEYPFTPLFTANYDVSLDGQRLLMMRGRQWAEGEAVIVLNWFNEWKVH
jgi:eukaryotic-like serine/threonine-protein kinase